jgi:hypothetical protein
MCKFDQNRQVAWYSGGHLGSLELHQGGGRFRGGRSDEMEELCLVQLPSFLAVAARYEERKVKIGIAASDWNCLEEII